MKEEGGFGKTFTSNLFPHPVDNVAYQDESLNPHLSVSAKNVGLFIFFSFFPHKATSSTPKWKSSFKAGCGEDVLQEESTSSHER